MDQMVVPEKQEITEVSFGELWASLEAGSLSLDDWAAVMYAVRDRRRELKWLFVELLAFGMDVLGETIYQYTDDLDLAEQTIHNMASLGRRWPRAKRLEMGIDLPIGYFEAVSRRWLSEGDAWQILSEVEPREFRRSDVRAAVRTIKDERLGVWAMEVVDGRTIEVCSGGWDEYKALYLDGPVAVISPPGIDDGIEALADPEGDGEESDDILYEFVDAEGLSLTVVSRLNRWLRTPRGRQWLEMKARTL